MVKLVKKFALEREGFRILYQSIREKVNKHIGIYYLMRRSICLDCDHSDYG